MGCASGKEEAATTDHEPPMFGKDIKVKLHKQGVLDQDFDVLDMKGKGPDDEGERWMLIDAVGTMGAEGLGGYDYFIKYKPVGAQKSYVLGAADDKSDQDYMSYVVTNGHVKRGQHKNVRLPWEKRNRRFLEKVVEADVIVVRRCRLYADEAKSTLVGRLDVSVQGKFTRVYRKEQWDVKKDKSSQRNTWGEPRSATKRRARFDIMNIQHKMVAYGTEYNIQFDTQKTGDILTSAEYVLQATRASDALPLFYVTSDGKKTANLETFSNSDPVNSILAAFVASIKMDPKELHTICKRTACNNIQFPRHLTGLIPTGERGGYGLTPNEYEAANPTPGETSKPPAMGFAYGAVVDGATSAFDAGAQCFTATTTTTTTTFTTIAMPPPITYAVNPNGGARKQGQSPSERFAERKFEKEQWAAGVEEAEDNEDPGDSSDEEDKPLDKSQRV